MTLSEHTALLLIDVQCGFDDPRWGTRNNPDAEAQMKRLLDAWRTAGWPVLHAQHLSTEPDSPLRPELPGCALRPETAPLEDEPLFQKHVNSAFIGTSLEDHLRSENLHTLVCAGLTTNHCVSTTVRMARNLGFSPYVVADATAAFGCTGYDGQMYTADMVHEVALASLHREFATVVQTDLLLETIRNA